MAPGSVVPLKVTAVFSTTAPFSGLVMVSGGGIVSGGSVTGGVVAGGSATGGAVTGGAVVVTGPSGMGMTGPGVSGGSGAVVVTTVVVVAGWTGSAVSWIWSTPAMPTRATSAAVPMAKRSARPRRRAATSRDTSAIGARVATATWTESTARAAM